MNSVSRLSFVALALSAGVVRAAPVDLGPACGALEERLGESERARARCEADAHASQEHARELGGKLEELGNKLEAVSGQRDREQAARAQLCAGASALASGFAEGRLSAQGVSGCVAPEQQERVAQELAAWGTVERLLRELVAYAIGEHDVPPVPPSDTRLPILDVVQHLIGGRGAPAVATRRLLIEAIERLAPRSFRRIRAGGAPALEAWFASVAPLDDGTVAEVQTLAADPGTQGERLAAAHRLALAFRLLTRCDQRAARGCVRAQRLLELLDTSGPLVVRRRVQDVWATDCGLVAPSVTARWTRDLPGAREQAEQGWAELLDAAAAKLHACFLRDANGDRSFARWLLRALPGAQEVDAPGLARLDELRRSALRAEAFERCGVAARALQTLPLPKSCGIDEGALGAVAAWARDPASGDALGRDPALRACAELVQDLWEGKAVTVPASFPRPPLPAEWVVGAHAPTPTPLARVRALCDRRAGRPSQVPAQLARFGRLAAALGESPAAPPWRLDPRGAPVEAARAAAAERPRGWLLHHARRLGACEALGLPAARCTLCSGAAEGAFYDCALVRAVERRWTRLDCRAALTLAALALSLTFASWLRRWRRARRAHGAWITEAVGHFAGLGLVAAPDPWRDLLPSRMSLLSVALPARSAWERWGRRACALRTTSGALTEAEVNRAARVAREQDAEVAIVVHDDQASPDLGAVRAMLEWAARGPGRAVQLLPVSTARLKWAASSDDLLDLIEESSLRGNPFELRGRITRSSQFFDRERLVSGLLAAVQAGHFTAVTGLRRFGKSSLALEVARRLPGASAYVDLAGFYDEIAHEPDPGRAADAILRYLCLKLRESTQARDAKASLPAAPGEGARLDAAELTRWLAELARGAAGPDGRPGLALIILDELEQAVGAGPQQIGRALEVLAIVLGRLRGSLVDAAAAQASGRVGVLLCSAIHPILAPLATLAGQSIMGAFQHATVPALEADAAQAMMRALGARQGIRFTEPALEQLVRASQGVPLLLRRLGSSVLELYDPERARQGALGAVEVGVEGARAAIAREEEDGAPLRVWVESEIADCGSPAGALLRELARHGRRETAALRRIAAEHVRATFVATGVAAALHPEELERRSAEAGGVVVRLLGETGLIAGEGDLTRPEAYTLPEGVIRRLLAG